MHHLARSNSPKDLSISSDVWCWGKGNGSMLRGCFPFTQYRHVSSGGDPCSWCCLYEIILSTSVVGIISTLGCFWVKVFSIPHVIASVPSWDLTIKKQPSTLFKIWLGFHTVCCHAESENLRLDMEYIISFSSSNLENSGEINWSSLSETTFSGIPYLEEVNQLIYITLLLVL